MFLINFCKTLCLLLCISLCTCTLQAQTVSTFAGNSNKVQMASGIAIDATGNVYLANTYEHTILKITPTGIISRFAGSGHDVHKHFPCSTCSSFQRWPGGIRRTFPGHSAFI